MDFLPNRPPPLRLLLTRPTFPRNVNMWSRSGTNSTLATSYPRTASRTRSVGQSIINRINNRHTVQKVLRATRMALSRRARSRTATMTNRRGKQVPAGGGGESKSHFSLHKPSIKSTTLGFLGRNTVVRTLGFAGSSTQGVQNATMLGRYFDVPDITNSFGAVGYTTATAALRSAKIILLGVTAKNFITNAETTNCHFTIYDVMSTNDEGVNNVNPAATFLAGNTDANGGAAVDATVPGATPYSNPRFVNCYRVLQTTQVILGPGMTHTHYVSYSPNRVFNLEKIYAPGLSVGPVGGLTVYSFIVQHGTPVHDATTETSVTLGLSKLDIVVSEEIHFQQALRDYAFNSISSALATNLTGEQMQDGAPTDLPDLS